MGKKMCIAIPGKILRIEKETATVDYLGERRKANIGNEKLKVGDYVLVQAGFIIQKLKKEEAEESIKLLKNLRQ